MVSYLHGIYRVSERRACRVARVPVSTFRYESRQEPRTALRLRIREIAQVRVRYGYRKIRVLLNREGWKVGKKLVYRWEQTIRTRGVCEPALEPCGEWKGSRTRCQGFKPDLGNSAVRHYRGASENVAMAEL
jgi:putative transposase